MTARRAVRAATATAMALVLSAVAPFETGVAWAGSEQIDRGYPDGGAVTDIDAVFRLTAVEVLAERDAPEICIHFNRDLDPDQPLAAAVRLTTVDGSPFAARMAPRAKGVCLLGVHHGGRYRLTIAADLRAIDGATLAAESERTLPVPDRRPSLAFGDAGFLRTHQADGLTLRSINVPAARIRLYLVSAGEGPGEALSERALAEAYFDAGAVGRSERIARDAREVWSGVIALGDGRNQPTTTQVPLAAMAGRLEPGVYVASARPEGGDGESADAVSAQWFLVSDLGINTVMGDDGLLIFARSLSTASPAAGVTVAVIGRDRGELAHAVTGADGLARIDAGALTTTIDKAPQVLLARSGGNVAVVELRGPREATGDDNDDVGDAPPFARPRLDGLIATDRRVYAPGSHLVGFVALRDLDGREVTGERMTLELVRPDGGVIERTRLEDAGGGGATFDLRLPGTATVGDWTLNLFDPTGEAVIGGALIRVDDSPRLGLALDMGAALIPAGAPNGRDGGEERVRVELTALTAERTPAARMNGRAFLTLAPARDAVSNFPDYRFGDSSPDPDPTTRIRYPLGDFEIGMDGRALLDVPLPGGVPADGAFDAVIEAELTVAGTPVATAHRRLPHRPSPITIGLHPRFDGSNIPDGATVAFDVIAADRRDGARVARSGVAYELIAEDSEFQWYETQGRWDYRRVWRDRRVAGGTLDLSATEPTRLAEPVAAGRYRLEVRDPGGAIATARFSAGWWMSPRPGPDPERVEVVAMRPATAGDSPDGDDTAWVFVRPPQPSQVLLMVADRRVRWAEVREIGAEGALVRVPSNGTSTRGAHVVATAFALPDADYRGPPRRALGTAWLTGAGSRGGPSAVVEVPASITAGTTTSVHLRIPDPGEPTFGLVAAVPDDLGADAFADAVMSAADEPRLAVELRDVYGGLIPVGERSKPARKRGALPPGAESRGRVWSSPVTAFADPRGGNAEATLPLTVPADAMAGSYRLVALTWNVGGVARTAVPLTVAASGVAADAPPAPPPMPIAPAVAWRGVLAAGQRATLTEKTRAGDRLFVSADVLPGVDLADSAARMSRPGPALGTEAAADRLLAALALGHDATGPRVVGALDELTAMWRPDGSFAAWGSSGTSAGSSPDPWLTAHALEAMRRTAERGGPAAAAMSARTAAWLAKWWDGCWSDPADLPACAYAAALLTTAWEDDGPALDRAAVVFLDETFGPRMPTALSRAHLAIALAAVGERDRAVRALARLPGARREEDAVRDHGSAARDAAAVVAVLARARSAVLAAGGDPVVSAQALAAAVDRLDARRVAPTSPPDPMAGDGEAVWTLAAAEALSDPRLSGQPVAVTVVVDGRETDSTTTRPTLIPLVEGGPAEIANRGERAARLALIGGTPAHDGEASTWNWARSTGAPLGSGEPNVGDALTAVIELRPVSADRPRRARLSVSLPPWLVPLTAPDVPEPFRARKTDHGVGVAFTVPAGVDRVRVSFAVRVAGPPTGGDGGGAAAALEGLDRPDDAGARIDRAVIHAPTLGLVP